jgi:thymidylate synthase (FAD)
MIPDMRQAWKIYESAIHNISKTYTILLEMGVAPEQARMVLPQSMMTEWYWTGSLAAWSRVCRLRISDDAQAETEKVAQDISREMKHLFPLSWAALEQNNG